MDCSQLIVSKKADFMRQKLQNRKHELKHWRQKVQRCLQVNLGLKYFFQYFFDRQKLIKTKIACEKLKQVPNEEDSCSSEQLLPCLQLQESYFSSDSQIENGQKMCLGKKQSELSESFEFKENMDPNIQFRDVDFSRYKQQKYQIKESSMRSTSPAKVVKQVYCPNCQRYLKPFLFFTHSHNEQDTQSPCKFSN